MITCKQLFDKDFGVKLKTSVKGTLIDGIKYSII